MDVTLLLMQLFGAFVASYAISTVIFGLPYLITKVGENNEDSKPKFNSKYRNYLTIGLTILGTII